MRPDVTLVIPNYNGEKYLASVLKEILAQTYRDFELLVVDDGSTDGSRAIVESFADSRVRWISNASRLGLPGNLNRAMSHVKTPYFALCAYDERYEPTWLFTLKDLLGQHPKAFFAACKADSCDETGKVYLSPAERYKDSFWPPQEPAVFEGEAALVLLAEGCYLICTVGLYRTEAFRKIGDFGSDWRFVGDWAHFARGLSLGYTIVGTHQRLAHYRRHPHNATHGIGPEARFSDYAEVTRQIAARVGTSPHPRIARNQLLSEFAEFLARGDLARADRLLAFGRKTLPDFRRSLHYGLASIARRFGRGGGRALVAMRDVLLKFAPQLGRASLESLLLFWGTLFFIGLTFPRLEQSAITAGTFFPIDGGNYVRGAWGMIANGDWIYCPNTWQSPGMQIVVASLFRLTGASSTIPIFLWNYAFWIGSVVLLGRLAGIGAAFLLALAHGLSYYVPMIQYEVTVSFLCLATCALQLRLTRGRSFVAGTLMGILSIFRLHFFFLLPLSLWFAKQKRGWMLLGFCLLAVPFNWRYAQKMNTGFFFFQSVRTDHSFWNDTSEISTGEIYPYTPRHPEAGLPFLLKKPGGYLLLLTARVGNFLGINHQAWVVESNWVSIFDKFPGPLRLRRVIFVFGCLVLLIIGLKATRAFPRAYVFLFPIVVVSAHLPFLNSTARFLVPAIPCLIFFQAFGIKSLFSRLRRYDSNQLMAPARSL